MYAFRFSKQPTMKNVKVTLSVEFEIGIYDHIDPAWLLKNAADKILDIPEYNRKLNPEIGRIDAIFTSLRSCEVIGDDQPG